MKEVDKAALITWLAEHGYSVSSISDNGPGPVTTFQEVNGQIIKTTLTTLVIKEEVTYQ